VTGSAARTVTDMGQDELFHTLDGGQVGQLPADGSGGQWPQVTGARSISTAR